MSSSSSSSLIGERNQQDGEQHDDGGGGGLRRRRWRRGREGARRAAAGVAEPHQHRVPVGGGVAALLHGRARLRPHPPPGLVRLRRRLVRMFNLLESYS